MTQDSARGHFGVQQEGEGKPELCILAVLTAGAWFIKCQNPREDKVVAKGEDSRGERSWKRPLEEERDQCPRCEGSFFISVL